MLKRSKYNKIPNAEPKAVTPEETSPSHVSDDEEDPPAPKLGSIDMEEEEAKIFDFLKGLFLTVVGPLVTLAVSLGGSVLAIASGSGLAIFLYPYVVAVMNFVGAAPSILGSFSAAKDLIFSVTDALSSAVDKAIDVYQGVVSADNFFYVSKGSSQDKLII